ncbi:mitochondrial S-adenosylmethionine carrier protein isoform X4 [Castor canadensis]|uniref:Mitochondrial S-adenosylmethionine carrier protein isoform X4 n=1 Tax=Castor canadensis TaxID=51338 RepID=A0AC58K5V3_CASCN
MDKPGLTASLVAGGVAGVSVDLILFPLDTIKTRLQSPQGFNKAGGFRGIYAGVPSAAIGSFPNAAAFFLTYEYVKWFLHTDSASCFVPVKHMLAASAGEVGIQGLYRGYKSTVLREIPFSLIQFPLWEYLKALWSWRQDHVVDSWQSAVCGAFAGGFAAAVTTPLDVAKTRIMLAKAGSSTASGNVLSALHGVWQSQGLAGCQHEWLQWEVGWPVLPHLSEPHSQGPQGSSRSSFLAAFSLSHHLAQHGGLSESPQDAIADILFAGVFPRMAAISLGGFIFLGAYDQTYSLLLEVGRKSL